MTVVLIVALLAACFIGAFEIGAQLFARIVLSRVTHFDLPTAWMAPVSSFLLILPVVALFWTLGSLSRRGWVRPFAVAAAATLGVLDLLLLLFGDRVHISALALLAIGVGARLGYMVEHRAPKSIHWARKLTIGFALTVAAGSLSMAMVGALPGTRASGARAPASAPNVLWLILDTVRASELSAYGYTKPTSPRMDAISREGVKFELAIATAPWTLPSHASMFTGRYQHDLSVGWLTPLDRRTPVIAEVFAAHGYRTGGFVGNRLFGIREFGLDRGFQTYRDYVVSWSQFWGSTRIGRRLVRLTNELRHTYVVAGRKTNDSVVEDFLDWAPDGPDSPWFAFVNLFDAHEPYWPKAPFDTLFTQSEPPTRRVPVRANFPPAIVPGLRQAYQGGVAADDASVGQILDELTRRGLLDNTIVVIVSDHGEEFAEHGLLSHGNSLYLPSLHVPLLIRWPGGVPSGIAIERPVSLLDLAATVLDLAGIHDSTGVSGTSLAPVWRGDSARALSPALSELYWVRNQPKSFPVARGNLHSLVSGRYHLIVNADGREELYDLYRDPSEQHNLAASPPDPFALAAMRGELARHPMRDRKGR
jgi:arylsulfatase A-like enzyme